MMLNDDVQLDEELHWQPRKRSAQQWERAPRGVSDIMAMGGARGLRARKNEPTPSFMSRGRNWGIPQQGGPVRFHEVQALCAKLGPKWRIPREDEVEKLAPAPPLGVTPAYLANAAHTNYWLLPAPGTSPRQDVFLRVLCMNKQCRPEVQRESKGRTADGENKGTAICVDF